MREFAHKRADITSEGREGGGEGREGEGHCYLKIHTVRSRLTILLPCTVPINCIANCTNVYDRIHLYNSNFDTRDPTLRPCRAGHVLLRAPTRMPKEQKVGSRDSLVSRNRKRGEYRNRKKRKRNDITTVLYTRQGTIIFLSLLATFAFLYLLRKTFLSLNRRYLWRPGKTNFLPSQETHSIR